MHKLSYEDTIRETSINQKESDVDSCHLENVVTGTETVCDYFNYCREICYNIVADNTEDSIGGEGKIVEIDESKFGKTKNGVGRQIQGQWVFGGICREDRKIFLETVATRDSDTLIPIIKSRIRPGSTIISDCWSSYTCLQREEIFKHLTVNHSYNFVDPESGAHTQNIENLWWQIKRSLPSTHCSKSDFWKHLAEYMWRTMIHPDADKFMSFLQMASKYYRGPQP